MCGVASKIQQNRLGIELARECLEKNGFINVRANREQGTFPHAHIIADVRHDHGRAG